MTQKKSTTCHICSTTDDFEICNVHDRMFSKKDVYAYLICPKCQSLQIDELPDPETLSALYHPEYYSFQAETPSTIKQKMQSLRDSAIMKSSSPVHRMIGEIIRRMQSDIKLETLATLGVKPHHQILDVGCGAGNLIDRLKRAGYAHVSGADPFITAPMTTQSGAPIQKSFMKNVEGTYDIIMFNHSFEHVVDPFETLQSAIMRLKEGGQCIIRVPTTSSEAWETYKEHWVQIDAPRHTFIPSRDGMTQLAKRAGASLMQCHDDSSAFQFIGSELYLRDLSLFPEHGGPSRAEKPLEYFSAEDVKNWQEKSRQLNQQQRGDQTSFVFTKAA